MAEIDLDGKYTDQLETVLFNGALSGAKGLELVKQHKPDLVLLDIYLPDSDGWKVLEDGTKKRFDKKTGQVIDA